tara:strand:+ start:1622 stop:1822 length:201 start_codon:yes stop_codon:yes gene_type:complete
MALTPKDFRLGKGGVVIGGDNIPFSAKRREAYLAYKQNAATMEQIELLNTTDEMLTKAIEGEKNDG